MPQKRPAADTLENTLEKLCKTVSERDAAIEKVQAAKQEVQRVDQETQRAKAALEKALDQFYALKEPKFILNSALSATREEIERLKQGSKLPEALAEGLAVIAKILNALDNHDPLEQFAHNTDCWNTLRRAHEFCINEDRSKNGDEDADDHVGSFLALTKTIAELVIWTKFLSEHTSMRLGYRCDVSLCTATGRFNLQLCRVRSQELFIKYLPSVLTAFLYDVVKLDHNSGFETSSLHGLSADELSLRGCNIKEFAATDTRIGHLSISSNPGFEKFKEPIKGLKTLFMPDTRSPIDSDESADLAPVAGTIETACIVHSSCKSLPFFNNLKMLSLDDKELWESVRSGKMLLSNNAYKVLYKLKAYEVRPPSEQGSAPTITKC